MWWFKIIIFFYNGKKIINYELTLDEYGINDEDIIFAVEKNDINNILKINQNSSNSLSQDCQKDLIILYFYSPLGIKSELKFNKNNTIKDALSKFYKSIGLSPQKMESLAFLFNGGILSINDGRFLGEFFRNNSTITVFDQGNIIGA